MLQRLSVILCVCAPLAPALAQESPVRLAVVIVVDQMLPEFLDRYGDLYVGGLARVVKEGAVFDHAYHDFSCTLTGPGHASLATGVLPSRHGIVGNDWFERAEGREVYCCGDSSYPLLGHPDERGVSPARLLAPTFAERLKTQHAESRVVSVALKDRTAVFLAGRRADLVLWLGHGTGELVTSRWYGDSLPAWVAEFQPFLTSFADSTWTKLLPDSNYKRSDPDRFTHEHDSARSEFPHACNPDQDSVREAYFTGLYYHPFGDLVVLRLAQAAVSELALGRGPAPDLLLVGCSAADGIGHRYGPDSHEVQDYYLRLDRWLGAFFEQLDARLGPDHWLLALTSDHGVLPLPERDLERGVPSRRVLTDTVRAQFKRLASEVSANWNVQLEPVRVEGGLAFATDVWGDSALTDAANSLARELRELDWIADVFTRPELDSQKMQRPYAQLFRNAHHPRRGPDLYIRERERVIVSSRRFGTTHGSPYAYDTRVPLVFMGPGIVPARRHDSVRTVDLAPTLCDLLRLQVDPGAHDGVSLVPALGR